MILQVRRNLQDQCGSKISTPCIVKIGVQNFCRRIRSDYEKSLTRIRAHRCLRTDQSEETGGKERKKKTRKRGHENRKTAPVRTLFSRRPGAHERARGKAERAFFREHVRLWIARAGHTRLDVILINTPSIRELTDIKVQIYCRT